MSILRVRTRIALEVEDTTCQATVSVTQGDNTREVIAALVEHGRPVAIPEGAYVLFMAEREVEEEDEDGVISVVDAPILDPCVVDHRNGTVIYSIPDDTTRAAGVFHGQLAVFAADGSILFCPRMTLAVRENRFPRGALEQTGFDTFADLIRQFAADRAEVLADNALIKADLTALTAAQSALAQYANDLSARHDREMNLFRAQVGTRFERLEARLASLEAGGGGGAPDVPEEPGELLVAYDAATGLASISSEGGEEITVDYDALTMIATVRGMSAVWDEATQVALLFYGNGANADGSVTATLDPVTGVALIGSDGNVSVGYDISTMTATLGGLKATWDGATQVALIQ